MALLFDASSEVVNCGSGSTLDDLAAGTTITWIYVTDLTYDIAVVTKSDYPGYATWFEHFIFISGKIGMEYHRATSDLRIRSVTTPASLNTWLMLAWVWDTAGANGDQKLYVGSLTAAAAEQTYDRQLVGSGSIVSNAAYNLEVHDADGTGGNAGNCRIAFLGMWNRALSAGEILDQQFRPRVTSGCVLFHHLGYAGTGTQPDWSGNGNSGAVTGATVADHVPLRPPFGHAVWSLPVAVAAAGVPRQMMYYSRLRRV